MTIEVTLSCDARRCNNSVEMFDIPTENTLHGAGWHEHPDEPETHYCDKCWPDVKREIEEIRGEEI